MRFANFCLSKRRAQGPCGSGACQNASRGCDPRPPDFSSVADDMDAGHVARAIVLGFRGKIADMLVDEAVGHAQLACDLTRGNEAIAENERATVEFPTVIELRDSEAAISSRVGRDHLSAPQRGNPGVRKTPDHRDTLSGEFGGSQAEP